MPTNIPPFMKFNKLSIEDAKDYRKSLALKVK